jgi:hypothetical protein
MSLEHVTVGLVILGGASRARDLALQLGRYTRSAPIGDERSYAHTKAALRASVARQPFVSGFVKFGDDEVVVSEQCVYIGEFVCGVDDVKVYAEASASLPVNRGSLQAVIALLAVAAFSRNENRSSLERRLLEYESSVI